MAGNLFSKKFTSHLARVIIRAHALGIGEKRAHTDGIRTAPGALDAPVPNVGIRHLLTALSEERGSIAAEIIHKASAPLPVERPRAEANENFLPKTLSALRLSGVASDALVKAVRTAHSHGHKYIGTEHLLASLVESPEPEAQEWWQERAVDFSELKKNLRVVLESTSKFPDLTSVFHSQGGAASAKESERQTALEYFGRELTSERVYRTIDPLIGRDAEVARLIHILCRRYKNNPILLGDAGVGKTAIVEGLAKRIAEGDVPPILAGKRIYTVDLGSVVAGTVYRGEFEARLKNLIEASEEDGNVILFIDEIHTVIGAGSASGSLDAANMLKPALARGKLSVIGATTVEEYKKHLEQDSALDRRFQPILVAEPDEEETKRVLAGIRQNYEAFHNVKIPDETIAAAVRLSSRYITEKLQPDKAIDLIDEAAAKIKVERSQQSIWQDIRKLELERQRVERQKRDAVASEAYSEAIALKRTETELAEALVAFRERANRDSERRVTVTPDDIAHVVSSLTKIPLGDIASGERELLVAFEERLEERIVGQREALGTIANLLRRSRTNVANPGKPLASFIFLGPSGVGKTETAKVIAQTLFRDREAFIRIDMSEFAEGFTVSRLIGAPAGYVGYRDSNKFTDLVRRRPHSVILLDEIEKAHPEIFNILLSVLEDGVLTDATGRTVNFKNTIIIMTSNIGRDPFNRAAHLGFAGEGSAAEREVAATEREALEELKRNFRPEFLNRVDSIVVFKPLAHDALLRIVELYRAELERRLAESGSTLALTPEAVQHIIAEGYRPDVGVRGIRRIFQDVVESKVAQFLLEHGEEARTFTVGVDNGMLAVF